MAKRNKPLNAEWDFDEADTKGRWPVTHSDAPDVPAQRHNDAEAVKAVFRRNTEQVQGQGDFALFDELFADDFVDHIPRPAPHQTKPAFAFSTTDCARRFPTSDPRSIDKTVDGDIVTTFKTYHGTHLGDFLAYGMAT